MSEPSDRLLVYARVWGDPADRIRVIHGRKFLRFATLGETREFAHAHGFAGISVRFRVPREFWARRTPAAALKAKFRCHRALA